MFNLSEILNDVYADMQAINDMAKEMKLAPTSIVEVRRFCNAEPRPLCVTFSSDNYNGAFFATLECCASVVSQGRNSAYRSIVPDWNCNITMP